MLPAPMSDLLTTSAKTAVQLAGGSRRSRHGRCAEGIRFRAHVHPLLTRCGRRKTSGLYWTLNSWTHTYTPSPPQPPTHHDIGNTYHDILPPNHLASVHTFVWRVVPAGSSSKVRGQNTCPLAGASSDLASLTFDGRTVNGKCCRKSLCSSAHP